MAPAAGIITSWRVAAESGPLALRVLEPAGGAAWTGAGTSGVATNLEAGANHTEVPIQAGDMIGLDLGPDAIVGGATGGAPPEDEIVGWGQPLLAEGETRAISAAEAKSKLYFNAQEELTPVVTSVSPASGSAGGGQTVTITGKYLDSAVNVVFGSHPATTFSVDLPGEHITATTPPSSAGPVDVEVSNQHSTSQTLAADRYTFVTPSGPPTGSGSPGGGAGQASTPLVTGFSESATKWRLGSALPHISSTPVGTTFAFTLNEPANVAVTFLQLLPGRRSSGHCVTPSRGNRRKPRCQRHVVAGSLAFAGHAGSNKVRFQGRLSRSTRLSPGSYTVSVTARDSHGPGTLTRSLAFTIVK